MKNLSINNNAVNRTIKSNPQVKSFIQDMFKYKWVWLDTPSINRILNKGKKFQVSTYKAEEIDEFLKKAKSSKRFLFQIYGTNKSHLVGCHSPLEDMVRILDEIGVRHKHGWKPKNSNTFFAYNHHLDNRKKETTISLMTVTN